MKHSDQRKNIFIEKFATLSKNQKKVAEYLLDHPQEMALSSITDIAKKIGVSDATIVRLAKALGYKGYLDMKNEILSQLRKDFEPVERFHARIDQDEFSGDILSTIAQQEISNISMTMNVIDKVSFHKAVDIIADAHHIYTMGLGISAFVSQITAYLLNRVTLKSTSLTHGSVSFIEQILPMQNKDIIITFSFPPYSTGTIEGAKCAREKGIKIIAISDKLTSPISEHCDAILQIKTENNIFANSLSAVVVLVYSIAAEVAFKDRKKTRRALKKLKEARTNYMLVVDKDYSQNEKYFY